MNKQVIPLNCISSLPIPLTHDLHVDVKVGNAFTITLDDNGGSTGYTWMYHLDQSGTVHFTDQNYEAPDVPLPGAAGTRHFQFVALQPGTTVITFELKRSWETGTPAKICTVEISVS